MEAVLSCPEAAVWLACPTSREQTDAFWQAVQPCRQNGIELVLCSLSDGDALPWRTHATRSRWAGVVLWPDEDGQRLREQAQAQGIAVCRLTVTPTIGLQPWGADCPSGQSRI